MRFGVVCYCLGIWAGTLLPVAILQYSYCVLLVCLLALASLVILFLKKGDGSILTGAESIRLLMFAFAFLIGLSWHGSWALSRLAERLPLEFENENLTVVGKVIGLPQQTARAQKFEFSVESGSSVIIGRKIQLNYFGSMAISGGQIWKFVVRLKQPRGFSNSAGFDFEAWALENRISATGYVRADTEQLIRDRSSVREQLRLMLMNYFDSSPSRGIVLALTVGDKNGISADHWRLFNATGTNHLWVISGLHIGLLAGFVFFLSKSLFRVGPRLLLRVPLIGISAVLAILAACAYGFLAGFSLSTQRALVMIVVVLGSHCVKRKLSWDSRVLVALLVVLSISPLAVMNPGFWFSFSAVAILLFFAETNAMRRRLPSDQSAERYAVIKSFVGMQFRISIVLLLPLSFWFGQFSLVSPMVNLVAIPVVSLLLVPLCLLLIPTVFLSSSLSHLMSLGIEFIVEKLILILERFQSALPGDLLLSSAINGAAVLLIAGLGLIAVFTAAWSQAQVNVSASLNAAANTASV